MAVIEDLVHLLPHEGGEAEDGRQEKQCLFHLQYLVKKQRRKGTQNNGLGVKDLRNGMKCGKVLREATSDIKHRNCQRK